MYKFSEKRLLYKNPDDFSGTREEQPAPPKSGADIRDDSKVQMAEMETECAESLAQTTASEVMIDLFGANYEEAKIKFGPGFMVFYESVEAALAEGWGYKGIKALPDDLDILWEKPDGEKGTISLKEYVGEDEYEIILELVSSENRTAIAKEKEKLLIPNQRARKFIGETIMPFIKKRRPKLKVLKNNSAFWRSDLVKEELLPILEAGYEADKPYRFTPKQNGFALKGADKNWPDQEFNFYGYDDNLDYIEESIKRDMEAFMANQLIPIIKKYRPYISNRQISESYMLREEIIPILYAGYAAKEPFKIHETPKGFVLSNTFEVFNRHRFNFDEYDENLNLHTGQKKRYETSAMSEMAKLAEAWKEFDLGPLPEGVADNMQQYIAEVDIDDFIKDFPDAESIRRERDPIEEAQQEHYGDEVDDWESLKDCLLEEGVTPKNMEAWERNFDSVAEKSGLPSEFGTAIKDLLYDARQKINNGTITTSVDLSSYFENEAMELERAFRAYNNEAQKNGDHVRLAGYDLLDSRIEAIFDLLKAELENRKP